MSEYLIKCLWKGVADVDQQQDAAERIEQLAANNEELEAKLAKAVGALDNFIRLDEDYSPFGGEIMQDRVARTWDNARTTLAELKGQDDGN